MTKIYEYTYWVDFTSSGGALTLRSSEVSDDRDDDSDDDISTFSEKIFTKTHSDGWTISWVIHSDYYEWVNYFEASHPTLWKVWGNFESTVFATKKKWFKDFYKNHVPEKWDYEDI